jgi:hypothetical protein
MTLGGGRCASDQRTMNDVRSRRHEPRPCAVAQDIWCKAATSTASTPTTSKPPMSAALLGFYAADDDLVTQAVAEFRAAHNASTAAQQAQLAAVNRQVKEAAAALDRYLIAFEKGALGEDDPEIGSRLTTLKNQSTKLRTRKAQLSYELDQPPLWRPRPPTLRLCCGCDRRIMQKPCVVTLSSSCPHGTGPAIFDA